MAYAMLLISGQYADGLTTWRFRLVTSDDSSEIIPSEAVPQGQSTSIPMQKVVAALDRAEALGWQVTSVMHTFFNTYPFERYRILMHAS